MGQEPVKATFVTFYSFKGGVGRSMALINTAGILAGRRGFRVLVLDLDLEAPGLSYLDPELPDVSPAEAQRQLPLQPGFVDLLSDAKDRGEIADLFTLSPAELEAKYTQKIKIPESLREFPEGSLRIMPAGLFDRDYAQRLDSLNLSALYREGLGEPLIRAFKKKFAEAGLYDYVLVDSRTGLSEGAGICTRDLADHLVILSGLNRQNVEGTCEFLREFRAATDSKKQFQIVLSPMPNGEDKLLDDRRAAAQRAFQGVWGGPVDLSLEIPYHPQLALTEEPHIFRRRRGYLFEAYRAIEANMLEALGHRTEVFLKRIIESLDRKAYGAALSELNHMIRLDGGKSALSRLAGDLTFPSGLLRRRSGGQGSQDAISFKELLKDPGGLRVAEFLVDNLSLGDRDYLAKQIIQELTRSSPELAERLVRRIFEAAKSDPDALGGYAVFFEQNGDIDNAETFYKRAVEADPKDADNLGNYADFLEKQERFEEAEAFFKRAIEADSKDASNLGNYAVFLEKRERFEEAEAFYKRAIDADPTHANSLGNYGQFLAGLGRLQEAETTLHSAFEHLDADESSNASECCFSLWLVSRLLEHDVERWEGHFRFLILQGFERPRWNFDRMLKQARTKLPSEEFEYANAMASAFLDETKVPALEEFDRWRNLEPLDPKTRLPPPAS